MKGNEVNIQHTGCLLSLLKALSEKKRDLEPYEEWLENTAFWVWTEKSGKVIGRWQWGWELGTGRVIVELLHGREIKLFL